MSETAPQIASQFVIQREGKQFVLYAGLLDLAHQQGLKKIDTSIVQIPTAENQHVAICTAIVETERGTFRGIGDASPANVTRLMLPHVLRMAETRAKARALRDAVNVGMAALEELGGDDEQPPPRAAAPVRPDQIPGVSKGVPQPARPPAGASAASATPLPREPSLPEVERDVNDDELVTKAGLIALAALRESAGVTKPLLASLVKNQLGKTDRTTLTRHELRRIEAWLSQLLPQDTPNEP